MTSHVRWCLLIAMSAVLAVPDAARANSEETLREIGDILQFALPAAGAGTAIVLQDWEGLGQWGKGSSKSKAS